MSGISTAAILGGAVIGAVGSNMAANTQASAQKQAANTQLGMFNTITGQEQPFIKLGYSAADMMKKDLPYFNQQFNPTQAQLNNYPGYQFALQTGGQAVRNADTPGVGALSGAALKDLTNFDVGTANQYYGQYFNQFQTQQNNIFNRLNGIASLGQNAAGNLGSAGTQLGTGIAQAQAGAGASQAGGIVGSTNALGGGLSTAALMNYYGANGGNNANSSAINGGVNSIYNNYSDYVNPPPTQPIGGG